MLPLTSGVGSRRNSLMSITSSPGSASSLGLRPVRDPSNLRFLALLLLACAGLLVLGLHAGPWTDPLARALPRGRGMTTVISTTTSLAARAGARGAAVTTELVVDRAGRASSTTVTRGAAENVKVAGVQGSVTSPGAGSDGGAGHGTEPGTGLPPWFDAAAYMAYHPELELEDEEEAGEHYMRTGRAEGRLAHRLRVVLRYTACTGLINQHYSHVSALSLARVLGAEVVLPPAVCRDSFEHYFSVFKDKNEVRWAPVPLDSLLDVDALVKGWKAEGLHLHHTPSLEPFPDLTQPGAAFPLYSQPEVDQGLVARLEGVYLKNLEMRELVDAARSAVVGRARSRLLAAASGNGTAPDAVPYVVLDLPCSFFMLRTLGDLALVARVARSLTFAPALVALGEEVADAASRGGAAPFNGVHLRIEKDARDWAMIMGGQQVVWQSYVRTMRGVGFNASTPLYAASGVLTYGASTDMARTVAYLRHMRVCSAIHHKEQYVPRAELERLNSEQKALLDFVVLAKSQLFVGFGSSTFSFYLREYRALQGLPRSTSALVDASIIGTDALFASAGTVV